MTSPLLNKYFWSVFLVPVELDFSAPNTKKQKRLVTRVWFLIWLVKHFKKPTDYLFNYNSYYCCAASFNALWNKRLWLGCSYDNFILLTLYRLRLNMLKDELKFMYMM